MSLSGESLPKKIEFDKTPPSRGVSSARLREIRDAVLNKNISAVIQLIEALIYQIRHGLISQGAAKFKMLRIMELVFGLGFANSARVRDLISELQQVFYLQYNVHLPLLEKLSDPERRPIVLTQDKIKLIVDLVMDTCLIDEGELETTQNPTSTPTPATSPDFSASQLELRKLKIKSIAQRPHRFRSVETMFFSMGAFSIPKPLLSGKKKPSDDDETSKRVRSSV